MGEIKGINDNQRKRAIDAISAREEEKTRRIDELLDASRAERLIHQSKTPAHLRLVK